MTLVTCYSIIHLTNHFCYKCTVTFAASCSLLQYCMRYAIQSSYVT